MADALWRTPAILKKHSKEILADWMRQLADVTIPVYFDPTKSSHAEKMPTAVPTED
jgi:hypothetical protein